MKEIILPDGFEIDRIEGNKVILKEKKLPKTWEEWVEQNPEVDREWCIDGNFSDVECVAGDRNIGENDYILPTKEQAQAILTLIKLLRLRDTYRQGWKPDYTNSTTKHAIVFSAGSLCLDQTSMCHELFSFQSKEIRAQFFYNFYDMLNELKCLF